jgi:ADP-heptose:LPS heptosyltransferase
VRIAILVGGGQVETLQTSPLLRTLRAGLPDAEITLACPPDSADLATGLDEAVQVLPLRTLAPGGGQWIGDWRRLRRRRVDVALLCTARPRHRLLAYLAGVPRRIGPSGGVSSVLLSDHCPDHGENPGRLWLRLAHLLGISLERHAPGFEPGDEARAAALGRLHSTGLADGRLLVALVPGPSLSGAPPATVAGTLWPGERWAHLANQLERRHGAAVVFVGTDTDERVVEAAAVDVAGPHADLAGELDLRGTAALLGLCDLVVSGDSPLLHLAAGMGTPTVGLFGPTDARRRAPCGETHRAVQALPPAPSKLPSRRAALMERIRVEDVLAAIEIPAPS